MMNKKRLAVLAMSAVMAASTVSVPVGAADLDFYDGAAGAEVQAATEAADFSADVDTQALEADTTDAPAVAATVENVVEKEWKNIEGTTPSLVVTVINSDDTSNDVTITTGFEKQTITATCQQEGGYKWTVTYLGQTFISDFVKTADKTDHNYIQHLEITTEPNCTTDGTGLSGLWCSDCHEWESTPKSVTIPAAHKFEGDPVITYDVSGGKGSNMQLVNNDNTVEPELIEKDKNGSYTKITTQTCVYCGQKVSTEETVNVPAKETVRGDRIRISDVKGIKTPLTEITDINDIPDEEDIELEDCEKDGSYVITYVDGNGDDLDSELVTVKAHHIMKVIDVEPVNSEDEKLISWNFNNGKFIVKNNTCLKDVEYYEISKCTVDGYETKEKKVAPKSDEHAIDRAAQAYVESLKAQIPYEDLMSNSNIKNNKYVKVVPETATCETAGTVSVEFYCQICGEKAATINGVKVGALGHVLTTKSENVKEATCQSEGSYEAVTVCERCGKETARKNVIIKRLPHTNETYKGGQYTDIVDSDKNSEVSIVLAGTKVFGPYKVNDTVKDTTTFGKGLDGEGGEVTANVFTDCATCHNHKVQLTSNNGVTFTVVSVTDETRNEYGVATKAGNITLKATYTTSDDEEVTTQVTLPYFSSSKDIAYRVGLVEGDDGVWRYYVDDVFQKDYTGFVTQDGKQLYVVNGIVATNVTGLIMFEDTWYYLSLGQVADYTGTVMYNGSWFYVTNGILDTDVNGLVPYNGGTFLFIGGYLADDVNGLWMSPEGEWYYLSMGRVLSEYTGVAMYDNAFFYIVNGKLASDYNGTVEYDGATFKVVNGMLQTK